MYLIRVMRNALPQATIYKRIESRKNHEDAHPSAL
jgi:hypothetical protein